jgi:hypothetical protein
VENTLVVDRDIFLPVMQAEYTAENLKRGVARWRQGASEWPTRSSGCRRRERAPYQIASQMCVDLATKAGRGRYAASAVHRHPPYPSGARDRNPSGHPITPRRPAPQWNRSESSRVRNHLRIPEAVLCDLAARGIFVI